MIHVYEIRPRKDHRGFDLISDALPSGGLWYLEVRQAIDFAKHQSRLHNAVIRVYDEACKLIEVHRHKGDFKNYARLYSADCRCRIGPRVRRIQIP